MAGRALWKGFLKFAEISCPVALHSAASTAERVSFNTLNRKTGNRVKREYVDIDTWKVVEREDQIKGYEVDDNRYILFEPDELAAAVPPSDKTLRIQSYVPFNEIDDLYFDKPYYLLPDRIGEETFVLIRDAMQESNVGAIAQAVLFRRLRTVLIRAQGSGLIATTLNFDYQVRSAKEAFADIPKLKIEGEMLELAKHIIKTKAGLFDPRTFDDRYDAALADLVKAKMEGRAVKVKKQPKVEPSTSLMEALRMSAGFGSARASKPRAAAAQRAASVPRRVAGKKAS
ncbi:DNA end-binding protein Ku [Pararhizobium capsulatum DSM 1112]|uniref:Non-homologous end joining protein Ku n=1 Tax=Pararhizobium capsulatum DSM 1112 TaxID=1121113 RepID=A0ABU0BQM0_9HYPH|nr:Ku protein [Pararhizobium capsulatum]MDQ0320049.1 DNA end-binding protein Ku [Pararhizobium capsulatum DSM 1112]